MTLPANFPDGHVCIIGLGYVGLTLAVAMADAGFRVTGVETSPEVLRHLREGRPHFAEAGLAEKLRRQLADGRLLIREQLDDRARAAVYIITVGTPLDEHKRARLDSIRTVAVALAAILEPGNMVVLRSTVRVGVTRGVVKPVLDRACVPYDLAFCPERTLEGKALEELRTLPQIVGGVTEAAELRAGQLFHTLTPTVVRVSSAEAAELVKLVNNTYRDLVFAFANEVAAMADAFGVSVVEVVHGGGLGYPRGQLPMPGPVGGACLEKDPYILAESVAGSGVRPVLTLQGRSVNEAVPMRAAADVAALCAGRRPRRIAVLGLAFKGRPETSDLRGTAAVPLIAELRARFPDARLLGFDPVVPPAALAGLGLEPVATLDAAFEGADAVVIQNNHPLFAAMDLATLAERMAWGGVVYDLWNQHDARRLRLPMGILYAGLGTLLGRPGDRVGRDGPIAANDDLRPGGAPRVAAAASEAMEGGR
jgi:UDP-N-acetyl-D-mannosaminuronic acid dehydrogenase